MPQPAVQLVFRRSPVTLHRLPSPAPAPAEPKPAPPPPAPPPAAQEDPQLARQLAYLEQLLCDVGLAVEDLQQQHRETLVEMQQAAVELAAVAASWVVGAAIEADQFAIDDLVSQMIDRLHTEQPIRIYLNQDDAVLLDSLKASSDVTEFARADVEFVADPGLVRGTVRATSSRSTLVSDLHERVADIRRTWLENLNETQTERRADDPAGRGFRRFPERRHTA